MKWTCVPGLEPTHVLFNAGHGGPARVRYTQFAGT